MNIPRFWARAKADARGRTGQPLALAAWGWSSTSRSEAEASARDRLARLVSRVEQGLDLPRGYAYGERPLREEILDEVRGRGGVVGVVTRNSYGSLVLNAPGALFIDVDLPSDAGGSLIGRLFGKRSTAETETLERLRTALTGATGGPFRIYRTAAGFRVLATGDVFMPGSGTTESLMTQVGADPEFVRLCRVQESFRARLTPKPWRCGVSSAPVRYPREEPDHEELFREWLEGYDQACASTATCRFVEEVGSGWAHPDVAPVLELHDRTTKASVDLPLA